ncbi:MAG TPA: hypothetical protein VG797_05995 [Phycisphaerales bacterium]|nr:hypothetical protein [Phycisphaerales bacterium]
MLMGRVLLGMAWAGLLTVAGLAVLGLGAAGPRSAAMGWFGVAGICAGTFVFMFVVADRLCPVAHRSPIDVAEMLLAAAMIIAFVVAIVLLVNA